MRWFLRLNRFLFELLRFRKIPWRRKLQPTPVFLAEKFRGQRWTIVHGVTKKSNETWRLNNTILHTH